MKEKWIDFRLKLNDLEEKVENKQLLSQEETYLQRGRRRLGTGRIIIGILSVPIMMFTKYCFGKLATSETERIIGNIAAYQLLFPAGYFMLMGAKDIYNSLKGRANQ